MEGPDVTISSYLRFPDDRSDSGVSSLRSGSGDERSGSRSSALSASDEPQAHTQRLGGSSSNSSCSSGCASAESPPVRVWRDPSLLLEAEPHVRHVNSVQHQSLLMSHPSAPATSGPPPPTSTTTNPIGSAHPGTLYAPVATPPAALMSPHPLQSHLAPPPPNALYPHHLPDMLWKPRGYALPSHLIATSQAAHVAAAAAAAAGDDLMERERERAYAQDRLHRERQNQELREMEKQQLKEREHKERERLERDKIEREREKQDKEKEHERERQEKQRAAEQAVHKHFEESLRRAHQKREQGSWNLILPPPQRSSSVEEERKRQDHEHHHQREQGQQLIMREARIRAYCNSSNQRPPGMPAKVEYPPPAHSKVGGGKPEKTPSHPSMPKAEVNVFGYPAYQPHNAFFAQEPKNKQEHHKGSMQANLIVTKTVGDRERERERERDHPDSSLLNELKNSVIVKHEAKTQQQQHPHQMDSKGNNMQSGKMLGHYLPQSAAHKVGLYEYRSPTQSPHHLTHPVASPHHHMDAQSMAKVHQRPAPTQMSHQRSSQHPHMHQHHSPELRYRSGSGGGGGGDPQALVYPASNKGMLSANFYLPPGTTVAAHAMNAANSAKPKVSSPAPHHIYGKPSGMPLVRGREASITPSPLPLTSKPPLSSSVSPSPFQQMSQYHPPHSSSSTSCLPPPPAHTSRVGSSADARAAMYDRLYPGGVPKQSMPPHHGTSPPTAASAPSPIMRPQMQQYCLPAGGPIAVQTQPLDLGVSSSKYESATSPKRKAPTLSPMNTSVMCLDNKKRKTEHSSINFHGHAMFVGGGQPQLARVSEPSPLIASAATTITTVVNTAAYRPPSAPLHQHHATPPETFAEVSVSAVSISTDLTKTSNGDANNCIDAATASTSPSPTSATLLLLQPVESPTTPIKPSLTPTPLDSDKSNSPGPTKVQAGSGVYPVRHLKKAWLQRHTGEDLEDTIGVTGGGGSCVTLPLNINTQMKETTMVPLLHPTASMAVNSIGKKAFAGKGGRKGAAHKDNSLNGDAVKGEDSSSSDAERGRKSPPKRKPPKVKRKKGAAAAVQKKLIDEQKKRKSESSESDKESGSEKDSDSGASATTVASTTSTKRIVNTVGGGKEPRKRGRRPKTSKNDKGEEPRTKRTKDDAILPQRDPFRKPSVGQLKKTGESFLQDGPCFEVAPKLAKCRECRWTPNQRSKNMPNIFCRFYAFRRLRYTKNGLLAIAGFSHPHKDALEDDIKLWLPTSESPPADLDLDTSRFILKQVGDHFCDLLLQEKEAHNEHMSDDKVVAWKRVVQGVREMCDVCETTLFNFHWACGKCGFVVCLDCYKSRKNGAMKIWGEGSQKDRDEFSWLLCTNRQPHEQEKLMLTQIIAGDSLLKLGKLVHEMRELWNIEQFCSCQLSREVSSKTNGAHKEIIQSILNGETNGLVNGTVNLKSEFPSLLGWLADVALSNENKKPVITEIDEDNRSNSSHASSEDSNEEKPSSTLRELLTNGSQTAPPPIIGPLVAKLSKKGQVKANTLDDVISSVIEDSVPKTNEIPDTKPELKHFIRKYNWQVKGRRPIPNRIMTVTESKVLYPDVPHNWLCDGKLLLLYDPNHTGNYKIFQDQWKRGQPVVVADVARLLSKDLWNPEAFARDFGDEKNDLVNCMNGNTVPNQPMRKFWEGFEYFAKRLKDEKGNPMLLKLKDWPPGEDFAELLPTRYNDLMKVLPLGEYTQRTGRLNLASRLPDCFVRPDLGPKMYNAYGSALHPTKGTTNLHLDISDAVNVMVYVGIPKDGNSEEHIKEAFRAIDQAGCDVLTRRNLRDELLKSLKGELPEALKRELPGALWHIYNARDADKIRDLLNKVVVEKGGRLEPHHDPIHDQSCYLDRGLRERLYKEYGVQGYTIVQCLGDAVFIPAGAPHQVLNLHNCIKVAEDFVSPENVAHCFHLTQEFRELSDHHSNHEDKLQIKNIIYHAVKDSLSTLMSVLNTHLVKIEKDSSERNGGDVEDTVIKSTDTVDAIV